MGPIVNAITMQPSTKQRQVKTKRPATPEATPRLPHERDESDDSQSSGPRDDMQQAFQDIEQGLVDTDLRGSMGVDDATRAPGNQPGPTPPAAGRTRDPNTRKMPDGK